MDGIFLLTYAVSLALACMALALSVASRMFHDTMWNTWCIVFVACLVYAMLLGFCARLTEVFLPPTAALVFDYIFKIMSHIVFGFVTVLLPYFLSRIINRPWGARHRVVFYSLGILYFASGLVSSLVKSDFYARVIQTPIFLGVLLYCLCVLAKSLKKIEAGPSRNVCLSIIIVSFSLIPSAVVIQIFPRFEGLGYPIYVLAFSIILIVYFYNRFSLDRHNMANSVQLSMEALSKYKITDREFEVMQYICSGYTNKEIAAELNISVNTVNNHVANIFEKMGINSRVDLLRIIKGGAGNGPWS